MVQTTSTIGEACQMSLNHVFHVVFIDCILLSQHGIDLAKKIREILGDSLEIVMISGIVARESITSFRDLNLLDFCKKPISRMKLDFILKQARDRYISSDSGNFLKNIFSDSFSSDLFLQLLTGLSRIPVTRLFPVLSGIFKSNEDLTLEILLSDNTLGYIFFQKGIISGFETDKRGLLENLLFENLLERKDVHRLKKEALDEGKVIQNAISEGRLSPWQIHTLQMKKLLEFMELISKETEVTIKVRLFQSKNNYMEVNQSVLADNIFPFLNNLPQKGLEEIFDKNILIAGFKIKPKKKSDKISCARKSFRGTDERGNKDFLPSISNVT